MMRRHPEERSDEGSLPNQKMLVKCGPRDPTGNREPATQNQLELRRPMAARDPRTLDLDASQPTAPAQLSGSAGVGEGVSSVAMEGGALAGIAPAGRVRASAPVAVAPYESVSDA